jgi:hypothetical protein
MDIARAKLKRERGVTYIDAKQRIVSRTEPILAYSVIHDKDGNIPVEWVKTFFGEERLPGFSLDRTIGLIEIVKCGLAMDAKITEMEKKEKKAD